MNRDTTDGFPLGWRTVTTFILCALALRLIFATGLIASDDLGYARYARQIAEGTYELEAHHFAIRFGLLLPVAAVYRVFGVAEWTSVIVPVLASSISVGLLVVITSRLFGRRAALVAGALYASFPLAVFYATVLVPEPVAEMYVLAGVLSYLHAGQRHQAALAALAGACVGLGYLTKEPALFVIVALGVDALWQKRWRVAMGLALGCAAVIAVEHSYYLAASGDLLFRPHAMRIHEQHPDVLDTNRELAYRLLKVYPRMMLVPSLAFGLHSLLAVGATALAVALIGIGRLRLVLLWAAFPLLYLNFGSSNLSEFIALPAAPRYIEFTYPPLFIAFGALAARLRFTSQRWGWAPEFAAALLCATGLACATAQTDQPRYYTHVAAALRSIARTARAANVTTVHFEADVQPRHRQTWAILAGDVRVSDDRGSAEMVIGLDRDGLPIVIAATPLVSIDVNRQLPVRQ
jgi:4-amino-4-deoxy-L-arabinose transferase-like glycosyltransferase